MNFYVNEILKDNHQEKIYRILWIDAGNIIMYILELGNSKAFPEKKLVSEIKDLTILGDWIKILDTSYDVVVSNEYEKKHYEIRDKAWKCIEEIVKEEPAIYEKTLRTKLVKMAQQKHQVTYPTMRKYLYKYWSRGKTIDALLPDYKNSGGKGKERKAGEKKRGRPPAMMKSYSSRTVRRWTFSSDLDHATPHNVAKTIFDRCISFQGRMMLGWEAHIAEEAR